MNNDNEPTEEEIAEDVNAFENKENPEIETEQ